MTCRVKFRTIYMDLFQSVKENTKIRAVGFIAPKDLKKIYFMAFLYFNFERTWWRLLQKPVARTKLDIYVFITSKCLIKCVCPGMYLLIVLKIHGDWTRYFVFKLVCLCSPMESWGRRGRDRVVVGFTTTCAISDYHH